MRRRRGAQDASRDRGAAYENRQLVGSPEYFADQLLQLGECYATESHYSARKKGGPALSGALHGAERLRYPWGAAPGGFAILFAVYWYQSFFIDNSTGDAAENQGYYDLILFAVGCVAISMVGDAVHTSVGHQAYYDPKYFKNYFENLADLITTNHPSYDLWLNPDPEDEGQCQQFYEFHLKVYQYLLNEDPRAAAYMLTSFTRDFPYFWRDRSVIVARQEEDAVPEPEADRRNRITRGIYFHRLGLCSAQEYVRLSEAVDNPASQDRLRELDEQLNTRLDEIAARADAIIAADEADTDDAKLVRRLDAFKQRLRRLIDEHIQPTATEALKGEAGRLVDALYPNFAAVLGGGQDIATLNFSGLLQPILAALQVGLTNSFRNRTDQEIADGIIVDRLKRYAQENVQSVLDYWQGGFSQFLRATSQTEHVRGNLLRERGMSDLIAAPGIGRHIGARQQNLLGGRATMAGNNAHRLAALNQALAELGHDIILDPMSATAFGTHANLVTREGPDTRLLDDPLNLNLLAGDTTRLSFVTRDGLQHAEFEVDGFLDSVIVFRGDDEAVEREEDYAEEGVNRAYQRKSLELKRRNAACKGWLYDYSETGPLPREAQELRREHPEWIMPKSDDPSYRQDYSMGSASVLLARETYRHIHGGRRLKTDTQRVKKLTNALRRFVGHINPLILHRPGRELEAQLHDRAHVAAHLLHQGGHYKHWEHWITHNEISTRAFMNLNVEQQVWLIFELLSGPDYAKLVALSILQDPLFVNAQFNIAMRGVTGDTPYNCFMRHYIEFMQKHVNDASQPSPVIETRKMLFIEQLTLMTEMSAGRETDPATGDPLEGRAGQIADFLNNHTRKSALILGALIGTLLPDRATHHRDEILPYLGEDDGEADEAEDVELSADAKQLNKLLELERYFKKLLGGSSANRDAEDLLTRRASVNVGDIGERVFIRKNLFHVRWLIAYYKARIHVGELFLSLGQNPRKQELIDDLIGAHPEFVMLALPLNNDHLDMGMLKHMLHRIDLSVMNDTLRNYIWHALAKIIENDSAFVIQFMLSNYSNLLTPRQVTGSLNSILQPPAVTAENRNTLIRYALTATRDARLPGWGHEQKKACVHALYVELAFSQGNSVFDFYQRLLNVEPQLLPLAINHSLDTMDWLIEYLHELKPDADQVAVQNMLSYSGDINIIDDLLAYYAVGVPDNVDKEISKSIISAWLKADRLRGHVPNQKFHAHEYIIGKLGEEFADHHFGLAASLIKINLTSDVPRWALINRALNALKASCVGLSEDAEDHMVDDQFSNARILFLLCQKGLITEQEKRQLAEGLINQYAGHRDDAAYEDYANYIWIHVNDAYPIPAAAVDGVDPALLTSEDRERITHCAQKIMGLLGSEARVSTQMPLADKVRDAIEDRHKIIDPNTSDRSLGFLMSAMLEYCVEQPDAGSQYTTLAFNCLMRRYHQFATEHFRESYWMGDEGEERPPQPWLRQLFFSYLRFFYREQGDALVIDADGDMVAANRNFSESIIQRFQTGAVAADGYDAYWQRFRESCVTLHYNWKVWKNGRDDSQAFSHLLTLAQCGFRAGNELLQGEQRNQVIQDAWHLLHAYLDYNVREIPSDNRRESFPDPSQWTAEQRLAVLNELYAYTPNPPEHDIGVGNLPEGCSTRTSLVAQLVHVFLNPGRLPENAFHNFATTLLRQIIINMRSVGYHIADDFMLINQLLNSLPDQLKKYPVGEVNDDTPVNERVNLRVKQRLVLAYAYWKWNNCSSRSWVSFFACGFSRTQDQNIAACHVQAMMQVLGINTSVGADAQARANARNVAVNVYPDEFLARLGIRGTFAAWFRARLNQDVSPPPQLSQLGGIQGDYEDQGEEAPLLGRDGLRLAEEGRISQQEQGAEDGSWWACFK